MFPVREHLPGPGRAFDSGGLDRHGCRRMTASTCPRRFLLDRGSYRAIRCSYHDWRYDLNGTLAAVPQRGDQFPDMALEEASLLPAAVGVWEGMVFACPDPQVGSLQAFLGDFHAAIGSFRPSLLPVVASADLTARCNWKLLVENHIDVYHLWYLHRETLGAFDHRRFEHRSIGAHWASYEPLRADRPRLTQHNPVIGHIDERDRKGKEPTCSSRACCSLPPPSSSCRTRSCPWHRTGAGWRSVSASNPVPTHRRCSEPPGRSSRRTSRRASVSRRRWRRPDSPSAR
ncbi:MAG: hypothetical protein CYG61_05545 [Actinobacteria bacterium]|nr:MAG: hypothetical protein CYG61_05545 [Actinomycetota bacterium]